MAARNTAEVYAIAGGRYQSHP